MSRDGCAKVSKSKTHIESHLQGSALPPVHAASTPAPAVAAFLALLDCILEDHELQPCSTALLAALATRTATTLVLNPASQKCDGVSDPASGAGPQGGERPIIHGDTPINGGACGAAAYAALAAALVAQPRVLMAWTSSPQFFEQVEQFLAVKQPSPEQLEALIPEVRSGSVRRACLCWHVKRG